MKIDIKKAYKDLKRISGRYWPATGIELVIINGTKDNLILQASNYLGDKIYSINSKGNISYKQKENSESSLDLTNINIKKEVARDGLFVAYSDGIVCDMKTDLEWIVGPDKGTDYHEAVKWVKNLKIAGGGWRIPTLIELYTLYNKGRGTRNMTPLLKTTGWWIWALHANDSPSFVRFDDGKHRCWDARGFDNRRAFAVRSRR